VKNCIYLLFYYVFSTITIAFSFNSESVHRESLIADANELEKKENRAGHFVSDSGLDLFINNIVKKLTASEDGSLTIKVKVLNDVSFNAFALANGTIFICTGLLAKIDNEAQLAALLGHEMTHITNNHSVQSLTNAKKSAYKNAKFRIGAEFFIGSLSGVISNYSLLTAITGYSRNLEREADSSGLVRMTRAGYAPIEFRNLFLKLNEYIEMGNIKQPFFFSTHPAVAERIDNYYKLIGKDTASASKGISNEGEFTKSIQKVLLIDAKANIAGGKFEYAEKEFKRILKSDSCNCEALVGSGDIERLKTSPKINSQAFKLYYKAKECNQNSSDALRALGFSFFRVGKTDSASFYLTDYLEKEPQSPDSSLIKDYLKQCAR
jgi:Zn-dependent protease with chaperone function